MKPELKRIEATLQHLANQRQPPSAIATSSDAPVGIPQPPATTGHTDHQPNYQPRLTGWDIADLAAVYPEIVLPPSPPTVSIEATLCAQSASAAPSPNLPQFVNPIIPGDGNRRAFGHPALAMNLLNNLQTTVKGWATALQTVVAQIEALYADGPIVDGWLESYPDLTPAQTPETGYRLCGLNEDGQVWCRPCPPEQVVDVSLAIARCQQLHNLLTQKRTLEANLCQIADALIALHGQTLSSPPS